MKHPVERERGKKYVGLPEFARASEAILAELSIEQQRGTVSLVPDERTIRYYLTEGLIQPAEEKQGTASVFGYIHLLQLVAVKKLQAEHLPIKKIRELVSGKDEQQLEGLLGVTTSQSKKTNETEAKRYLESRSRCAVSRRTPHDFASRNIHEISDGVHHHQLRTFAQPVQNIFLQTRHEIAEHKEFAILV